MRALNVPTSGAEPTISDLPVPSASPGTVLVKVKAAALNAIDNTLAAGVMAQMLPHEYPLVLGRDAAGVVEAVGDGVDHVSVGDEVLGHVLLAPPIKVGTLAEYAVLPADAVVAKPAGLDFVAAAALPLAGATAVASVDAIDAQPGQTVLVVGASGGVGSYAVQLLAARGVTVIGTATMDDFERLIHLGVKTVIDYTAGDVADQVLAAYSDGVDALIDLVAQSAAAMPLRVVRPGGKIASTLGAAGDEAVANAGLTGTDVMGGPVRDIVGPLAQQAAAGEISVDVRHVLPFEKAAKGLAILASGEARGKIVVTVGESA